MGKVKSYYMQEEDDEVNYECDLEHEEYLALQKDLKENWYYRIETTTEESELVTRCMYALGSVCLFLQIVLAIDLIIHW